MIRARSDGRRTPARLLWVARAESPGRRLLLPADRRDRQHPPQTLRRTAAAVGVAAHGARTARHAASQRSATQLPRGARRAVTLDRAEPHRPNSTGRAEYGQRVVGPGLTVAARRAAPVRPPLRLLSRRTDRVVSRRRESGEGGAGARELRRDLLLLVPDNRPFGGAHAGSPQRL